MDTAHQILAERRRQIMTGHSVELDDYHFGGELLLAGLAYICSPGESIWPWDRPFNPSKDPVQNLVTAGAYVAAEGDRLLRRREAGLPVVGGMIVLGLDPEEIISNVDGLRRIRNEMLTLGDFGA